MTKKEEFDLQIKHEMNLDNSNCGYRINGKVYKNYFSNECWKNMLDEMKENYPTIYRCFSNGFELNEHTVKRCTYPPKMASVVSSSRLLYMLCKNGNMKPLKIYAKATNDFVFEKSLPIISGNKTIAHSHLDGFYCENNYAIFIEAKCHEIFDYHVLRLSKSYEELIKSEFGDCFQIIDNKIVFKKEDFKVNTDDKLLFDIKQFICHLLAISKTKCENKKLIYVYFKPESYEYDSIYNQLKTQFKNILQTEFIKKFTDKHKIEVNLECIKHSQM